MENAKKSIDLVLFAFTEGIHSWWGGFVAFAALYAPLNILWIARKKIRAFNAEKKFDCFWFWSMDSALTFFTGRRRRRRSKASSSRPGTRRALGKFAFRPLCPPTLTSWTPGLDLWSFLHKRLSADTSYAASDIISAPSQFSTAPKFLQHHVVEAILREAHRSRSLRHVQRFVAIRFL